MELFVLILQTFFPLVFCNWESEWLVPLRDSFSKDTPRQIDNPQIKIFEDEAPGLPSMYEDFGHQKIMMHKDMSLEAQSGETISTSLSDKLKNTLQNAKILADTLKTQILLVASREHLLKETIVNGRSGVTVLTLASVGKLPRTYIIRDGFWTLCNGIVQHPTNGIGSSNNFNELFTSPRCIGQEVISRQDPCVFNSVVKYETIPRRRGNVYTEEDYLCLKPSFNQTLEQYLSVPKYVVEDTCRDGLVKRLADNTLECGSRMMSEYTYYPKSANINLPLEYCSEKDGSCNLVVAWHISNSSIENFEYLKHDKDFKKFFLNIDYNDNTKIL